MSRKCVCVCVKLCLCVCVFVFVFDECMKFIIIIIIRAAYIMTTFLSERAAIYFHQRNRFSAIWVSWIKDFSFCLEFPHHRSNICQESTCNHTGYLFLSTIYILLYCSSLVIIHVEWKMYLWKRSHLLSQAVRKIV